MSHQEQDEHPNCQFCPHPCGQCGQFCFEGRCYNCFSDRIIPCQRCGEMLWDGDCDCILCDECNEYICSCPYYYGGPEHYYEEEDHNHDHDQDQQVNSN